MRNECWRWQKSCSTLQSKPQSESAAEFFRDCERGFHWTGPGNSHDSGVHVVFMLMDASWRVPAIKKLMDHNITTVQTRVTDDDLERCVGNALPLENVTRAT